MWSLLIVEDDKDIRECLARIFAKRLPVSEVFTAANGREGIEFFKQKEPDCVLLDVGLPDISGMEAIKVMREWSPSTPVYFMTGSGDIVNEDNYRVLGAQGLIRKPIPIPELLERLKQIIPAPATTSLYSETGPAKP